jgi:hypothetical protein
MSSSKPFTSQCGKFSTSNTVNKFPKKRFTAVFTLRSDRKPLYCWGKTEGMGKAIRQFINNLREFDSTIRRGLLFYICWRSYKRHIWCFTWFFLPEQCTKQLWNVFPSIFPLSKQRCRVNVIFEFRELTQGNEILPIIIDVRKLKQPIVDLLMTILK